MNCFWFGAIKAFFVSFFESALMGCFVSCFRSKDRDRRIQLRATARPNSDSCFDLESLEERLVVDNQLGSFFLTGEKDTEENIGHPLTLDEELSLEAKNLKLCGAIPETPMEIRKVNKRIPLQELNGTEQSPNSAHTLSNKKIQLYVLREQENSLAQEIIATPGSEKENPVSRQNTPETGSVEEMKCGKMDLTPVRYGKGIRSSLTNSPFPTPITLTDNMQTPATIYSSYPEAPATGKWARIRTQYAYPAVKPAHREEITSGNKSVVEKENDVSGRGFSLCTERSCEETPKILVSGSSEQLKTVTALRGRNGIPNTTTKYKEDQKVKWHSTPFEERLERILSDEKMPPPRKLI
ncbi:hypothetical protein LUZ63_003636 [Rhynchospora breviuscula]|uniref:Uncharacterized protein n=1 Tax=Rhynchospora breviuscula TaxID=2022672 RepID=A0A9Q0HZ74_9POAL|nr:hypothetical protein LUZ63_003636 [Rhynchospora breviuscula]